MGHQPENQPGRVTDTRDVPPALIGGDWVRQNVIASTRVFGRRVNISSDQLAAFFPFVKQGWVVSDEFPFPMTYWDSDAIDSLCPDAWAFWVELQ